MLRRAVAAGTIMLILAAWSSGISRAATASSCWVKQPNGWESLSVDARVESVRATAGALFVATDASVQTMSEDGCESETIFDGTSISATGSVNDNSATVVVGAYGIVDMEIPAAPGNDHIYLLGADTAGKPITVVSDGLSGQPMWRASDEGLPAQGVIQDLAVSDSDPQRAYLSLRVPPRAVQDWVDYGLHDGPTGDGDTDRSGVTALYETTDAGNSWSMRYSSVSTGAGASYPIEGPSTIDLLKVDPSDADTLWASSEGGLFVSKDSGATWTTALAAGLDSLPGASPDVRALDVFHRGGTFEATGLDMNVGAIFSSSDAANWRVQRLAGGKATYFGVLPGSVVYGPTTETVLASTTKGVFRRVGGLWVDISPPFNYVHKLTSDDAPVSTFYGIVGYGNETILRYKATDTFGASTGLVDTTFEVGQIVDPSDLQPPGPTRFGPATIAAPEGSIRIPLLGSRTVSYSLSMPPKPSSLDVYFLTDSTGSMSGAITGLRRALADIAGGIAKAGINVQAGVGEYRTYRSVSDTRKNVDNYAYRQDRDIGPIDADLANAIGNIDADGNSGSALTALYQSATGEGQDLVPPGPSDNDIPEGTQAHWRPGAQRLVVIAADRYFNTPSRPIAPGEYYGDSGPWPGPDFEPVIAALNREAIHVVGIAVAPQEGDVFGDLRKVASETGTFATTGVDCDGDRDHDVLKGSPIVCGLGRDANAPQSLATGIVNMIKAVKDSADIRIEETSNSGIVRSITPDEFLDLSLKTSHQLEFTVTYSCGFEDIGKTFDVDLAALQGARGIAGASTRVECLSKPSVETPIARPQTKVELPLVAIGLPPWPPPPPPPPPVTAPAPNPAPAPAQAPVANAQPVAVPQRQVQPQMALVHAAKGQLQEQTAMVRTSSRADPLGGPKAALAVGAISMVMAWGYVNLAMSRVRPARNGARNR